MKALQTGNFESRFVNAALHMRRYFKSLSKEFNLLDRFFDFKRQFLLFGSQVLRAEDPYLQIPIIYCRLRFSVLGKSVLPPVCVCRTRLSGTSSHVRVAHAHPNVSQMFNIFASLLYLLYTLCNFIINSSAFIFR